MNWASVAATAAPVAAPAAPTDGPKPRIAVVDANALITQHGLLNLARFSDKCITTPEVLREVRDKQSRASLAALPFAIDTQEPAEDSVKAGKGELRRGGGEMLSKEGAAGTCIVAAQRVSAAARAPPMSPPALPLAAAARCCARAALPHAHRLPPPDLIPLQWSSLRGQPATSTPSLLLMCAS